MLCCNHRLCKGINVVACEPAGGVRFGVDASTSDVAINTCVKGKTSFFLSCLAGERTPWTPPHHTSSWTPSCAMLQSCEEGSMAVLSCWSLALCCPVTPHSSHVTRYAVVLALAAPFSSRALLACLYSKKRVLGSRKLLFYDAPGGNSQGKKHA